MTMRKLLIFCFLAIWRLALSAQDQDTTIYQAVELMPRFPGCEQLDTTLEARQQCASQQLLGFIYNNVRYPQQAIQGNIEGTVVLTFVVEKDGTISSPKVLKDIGGGCGEEALRVIGLMNPNNIRWIPGRNKGQAVRTQFNLPVRFKLEEPLPYSLVDGDTIYTQFDEPLEFLGGPDSLAAYLNRRLQYPESGNDSCLVGRVDVQALINPDGRVWILDIIDYSGLGFDFWYEAIDATTSTIGKWKPARYEGRSVPAAFDLTMTFTPTDDACKMIIDDYNRAVTLADEGAALFNEEKQEEGIAKMTEALALFPNDAGLLLMRGQAYLDMNKLPEACADLSKARGIALINWYDNILPLICRP